MGTHNLCFEQKEENYQNFSTEIFYFLLLKKYLLLHGHDYIMNIGENKHE